MASPISATITVTRRTALLQMISAEADLEEASMNEKKVKKPKKQQKKGKGKTGRKA